MTAHENGGGAEETLGCVVAETGQLVTREIDALLAMIRMDPAVRRLDMIPLLVRGTTSAALDALDAGRPERAVAPLARLAGGAWLALILLALDPDIRATAVHKGDATTQNDGSPRMCPP